MSRVNINGDSLSKADAIKWVKERNSYYKKSGLKGMVAEWRYIKSESNYAVYIQYKRYLIRYSINTSLSLKKKRFKSTEFYNYTKRRWMHGR